jgi:hypothetical protein
METKIMPHKVENVTSQIFAPKNESFGGNGSKVQINIEPYPFVSSLSMVVDADDSADFEN